MNTKSLNIHSTPEQIQAYRTQQTTEAVIGVDNSIKNTNNEIKTLQDKVSELTDATIENHPYEVVLKLEDVKKENIDTNEKLSQLEKNAQETQELMKTLINTVKQKALPVELIGLEQVVIQGERGEKGDKGEKPTENELLRLIKPLIDDTIRGERGYDGEKGDKGERGEQGIAGPKGEKGDKGDKGPKGDKGERGEKGSDASITFEKLSDLLNSNINFLDFRTLKNIPDFVLQKDILGTQGGGGRDITWRNSSGTIISQYVTDIQFGSGITTSYNNGVITLTSSGGGSPAGSNTQIQYNDAGSFGGSSTFIFNKIDSSFRLSGGSGNITFLTTGITFIGNSSTTGSITIGNTGSSSSVTVAGGSNGANFVSSGITTIRSGATSVLNIGDTQTTGTINIGATGSTGVLNLKSGSGGITLNINGTVFNMPSIDGTPNQALVTNGSGTLSFASVGVPAGSNREIQFNNAGVFGTDPSFYLKNTGELVTSILETNTITAVGNLNISGAITTLTSSGASSITVDSSSTGTVNIGTGANSKTINIGNTTGTTDLNLSSGLGNINISGDIISSNNNIQVNGSSGKTFKWVNNTTAPTSTLLALPVSILVYGGTSAFLGDPIDWAIVNVNGTDRKIPLY